jgi:hypothetical protein
MDKTSTIVLVLIGVVLFSVGGGLGVIYEGQKLAPELEQKQRFSEILSSQIISSIVAYGKAEKIEGQNITLNYREENITIKIREKAPVYYLSTTQPQEETNKISMEDIKIGDYLFISIVISEDGYLEGTTITIPE